VNAIISEPPFIRPDWPAPQTVLAAASTRLGGYSAAPFDGFNLGDHVGDEAPAVAANRTLLCASLALPAEPAWLNQVHGVRVVHSDAVNAGGACAADACWTDRPDAVCAVLTADCLPVLFSAGDGSCVAAAHAGWRGLAGGVLEATVAALPVPPQQLIAWLGPAIGPTAFEVGDEVRTAFCDADAAAAAAFAPASRDGHWLADLYLLARQRLAVAGLSAVFGGGICTVSDSRRFFSYRRDGASGRMASLVWLRAG